MYHSLPTKLKEQVHELIEESGVTPGQLMRMNINESIEVVKLIVKQIMKDPKYQELKNIIEGGHNEKQQRN